MSANLDVVLRSLIPSELQGRVYACRNTMQFFTIPIGTFIGGFLVDKVCEPLITKCTGDSIMNKLFGVGKGSGAALTMFILGVTGVMVSLTVGIKIKKYRFTEK
ncbi:MAG: hypothetical protein MJ153_05765 [Clostridia bacterium]|nr:hypothetical protein [Clostridia bacterium]